MIHHWSFYDKETGLFTGQVFGATDESALAANVPEGQSAIDGEHDHLSRRVDISTGEVVDYKPLAPSDLHEWHADSKRWKLNSEVEAKVAARVSAAAQIRDLESRAVRALIEQALGHEGAKERLEALHKQIADLRPAL